MFVGLSTEGMGESGGWGNVALPFDRGPNLDLRLGLPKANVICLIGEIPADLGGVSTIEEGLSTDATAERGAGDRLTVSRVGLAVLTSATGKSR
jgi:hypothetical protein